MNNGRFGPIESNQKPKKTYKVDYNRLVTVLMIAVIIVLGVVIFMDAKKEPEEMYSFPMSVSADQSSVPVSEPTPKPFSPEEIRPLPEEEGLLPIFRRANIPDKKVAIIVDTFEDEDHIETLLGLSGTFSAKITFFPTGIELRLYPDQWMNAAFAGHEIENHTFDNTRLSTMADEDKAENVLLQTEILRSMIGEDYMPHFLKTGNLEDDSDAFLHSWLEGNGYMGIARYDERMPASFDLVNPGAVLSYPLTDEGMKALSNAIPVLYENGYEVVTLNDLFMYPDNFGDNTENAG